MEWLAKAGEMAELARMATSVLEIMLSFIGAGTVIFVASYGAYTIWHRKHDRRRRIDALFTLPGEWPGRDSAPSRFLREEFQIVEFRGRKKEIEELTDWARHRTPPGKNVSIALVTGGPGRGKSRLARRLCEHARDWNGGTWIAGFLEKDAGDVNRNDFLLLMEKQRPVLAIIDYAERRAEQTTKLVSAALAMDRRKHPVRILLIARAKNEEWWSGLEDAFNNYSINPFEDEQAKLLALAPLEGDPAVANRRQEFNRALTAFQKALGKDEQIKASKDGIPNYLSSEMQKVEVLDIHIAALLAAYGGNGGGGAGQANVEERLLNNLVRREQKVWAQAIDKDFKGRGLKKTPIRHAIAWLATTDGLTSEDDAVNRLFLLPSFSESTRECRVSVARIIATLYPNEGEAWWGGMAPDRLTTWLTRELDEIIKVDATKEPSVVVAGLPDDALANLLRHLTWRVQRYGNEHEKMLSNAVRAGAGRGIVAAAKVGMEAGDPIGRIAAEILSKTADVEVAREVAGLIANGETVSLRELVLVSARILHHNAASDEERAGYANNLSACLSSLGRHEEALIAIEEGAALHRKLAATQPDAFFPHLATSLNNLSACLYDLGRREEALAAIEEATALHRKLAATQPDTFRPGLAMSLSNLSGYLSGLGRREEALVAIEEAVTLYRELATARHSTFRPNLAASLNNLSACLSGLGQREAALLAIQEGTALYRDLATTRPDAFHPNLAASLNNLSTCLSYLGRYAEALAAIEEAVAIRRSLAATRPDAFRPDLAASLSSLSNRLSGFGRHEEALTAIEEAVDIRSELAATRPGAFRPDLAESLNNLGIHLSGLGRREEALEAIKKGEDLYRELATSWPGTFRPDLAMSLNNLGTCLSGLGRREEALEAIKKGADLYRELAAARPDAFHPDLAMNLSNLSACLFALGRREEALVAVKEALAIRRKLADARPDEFLPDLAVSLGLLSACLSALERSKEALAVVEEAVAIRRELAKTRPDEFRPGLAESLSLLSDRLSDLGRHEEASKVIEEVNSLALPG